MQVSSILEAPAHRTKQAPSRRRSRVWLILACTGAIVITLRTTSRRPTSAQLQSLPHGAGNGQGRWSPQSDVAITTRHACPVAFKNISCAAYGAILNDVRHGSLRACMSDVNTAHHPRQLSGGHQPALIHWDRECANRSLFAFTSSSRDVPPLHSDTYSVFVEMEPPDVTGLRPLAQPEFASSFDLVLSLADAGQYYNGRPPHNIVQWPYGSSSIPRKHWSARYPKTKLCSIIVSDKNTTEGHKLRHRVVAMLQSEFAGTCDVYGRGYRPIESKLEGLRDYMFTIVIENSRHSMYMTEKIMDAALTGVVPIYWGSPFAEQLFEGGMLPWTTLDELKSNVNRLSADMFDQMKPQLSHNFRAALHYVPPEQWLWENVMKCVYEWHLAHPPSGCAPAAAIKLPASVLVGFGAALDRVVT